MQALNGIKVLELSRVLAGPWCGMMLADLGADVIKLESFDGDDTRGLGPPFKGELSAYFACCNRNKRSICIDLRNPQSRPLLEALLREADVLIENYRTGTAELLGVGYDTVSAINPRLVYCSISGYGRDGPHADRAGYDYVVQAEAGLMSITGEAEGAPHKVGIAIADLATGQNAAFAILAALRHRDMFGIGQRIDISLFDTQLSWLANVGSNVLFTDNDAERYGNHHANIVPYQTFKAADKEFVLAIASEKLWLDLCEVLQRDDWLRDPRFLNNAMRVKNRDALSKDMENFFCTQTSEHWLKLFAVAGIPAAPINTVKQAIQHPVSQAHGMKIEIDNIPMIGSPIRLSGTPVEYVRRPPKLGEHSNEICREFGLNANELRKNGAIR
jgi:crotonobetainyl-CoA:carnitine CoA-transferase CaiB-like acyl-CoA transferase